MIAETVSRTKQIDQILAGIKCSITGEMAQTEITGICSDSRKAEPGNLFAALQGLKHDGHDHLHQAAAAGCSALLINRDRLKDAASAGVPPEITIIAVDSTREVLGQLAANFYDHPERQMTMIGITGTNGKTTTAFLVESLLKTCGKQPGVIGTVNYHYTNMTGDVLEMSAPFTTPESITLFQVLRNMADEHVTDVIMEVSSHGLAQGRLGGLLFDIGVFTNLSRDHLDFHSDMQDYFASKKLLFSRYLKPGGKIVLVLDDRAETAADNQEKNSARTAWGTILYEELKHHFQGKNNPAGIITCGLDGNCDVHPRDYSIDINGITAEINTPAGCLALKSLLVGEFNLRNILCAIGIGIAHQEHLACMKAGLEGIHTIPGRLERIKPADPDLLQPGVFVDYAHTPDALEKALTTLRELASGRLICVFGCGGDRDAGKRPLMGEVAGRLCDVVLATSDNPRSELPENILIQIEKGLKKTSLQKTSGRKVLTEPDGRGYDIMVKRQAAIMTAIRYAYPDDVILISGKGHENYQILGSARIFFDDRLAAEMQLQAESGSPHVWRLDWLQQITGGRLMYPFEKPLYFNNISTDTRTIQAGDLFVGLKGENFDGSSFARQAVAKGASGLLLNCRPEQSKSPLDFAVPVPVILVPDTIAALGEMAGSIRRWYRNLRIVALTGSSGKTTVKEMTGAILAQNHHILKTEGNFNNLVGLPLTLFKLRPEHDIGVLEMGMNRPGEIARLTEIADPDVACIINVQEAHLEGLGDIKGVAKAKNELFAGLKPESVVVVNQDDDIVRSLAEPLTQEKITFGCHPESYVRASDIQSLAEKGMEYRLHIGSETRRVVIKALGMHNVTNSLAAAALSYACGSSIAEISNGLSLFEPYDRRAHIEVLESGINVLNDCYNANPSSMRAALHTLADLKKNHRAVAVLGDMLELGAKTETAHLQLGRTVVNLGFDFLAAFGGQAENVVASARQAGMASSAAQSFRSKSELVSWLKDLIEQDKIRPGDWLLIKGSRGMRLEEVISLLGSRNKRIKAEGN